MVVPVSPNKTKLERTTANRDTNTTAALWNRIFTPRELKLLPYTILVTVVVWVLSVQYSILPELVPIDHYHDELAIAPRVVEYDDPFIKSFVPWNQRKNHSTPIPCILDAPALDPMDDRVQIKPSDEGLLYIKLHRASSDLLAGVAARTAIAIAKRNAEPKTNSSSSCRFRGLSSRWSERMTAPFSSRNHDKTFLWTFLKTPSQHALDMYLYDDKTKFDLQSFFRFFYTGGDHATTTIGSFQARALSNLQNDNFDSVALKRNTSLLENFVREVVDDMDFVGTVERMDESLVLLSIMLDLEVTDVLYYNDNNNDHMKTMEEFRSGNYTKQSKLTEDCTPLGVDMPLPPAMTLFLESSELQELLKIDNALYDAVNKKLDKTIQQTIGRTNFDRKLQEFVAAKTKAESVCRTTIKLACTTDKTPIPLRERSKCYAPNIGCGHECLDEVFPLTTNTKNGS